MKKFIFSLCLLATIYGCSDSGGSSGGNSDSDPVTSASFAVISDPHIYDEETLGSNTAFTEYLSNDRKMLVESVEILDTVIEDLKTRALDFVLIAGDLTKDGETVNHELLISKLKEVQEAGIKIYVVPGNHDINNPHALDYNSEDGTASQVDYVTPSEYKAMYADFGYSDALYEDPDSLSYVAEPVKGVWLFGIDSCIYDTNIDDGSPETGGTINDSSLEWIISKLQEAEEKGKLVIGMEHHGIVEHFSYQSALFSDYVLANYAEVGEQLAENGLNIMFTGHFHANDITVGDFTTSKLYDVETGSLVTAPSPYRLIELNIPDKTFAISTETVQSIASNTSDFVAYAHEYLLPGLEGITESMLSSYGIELDAATSAVVVTQLVHGFISHYAGDENMSTYNLDDTITSTTLLAYYSAIETAASSGDSGAQLLLAYINAIWTDLDPDDNDITIILE